MRQAWYVLAALTVICSFNMIDRYLLAGLVGPIKADLDVSDTYIGFLLGPSFAILYTAAAIPIARLADRLSRVKILAAGCATWSLFTVLSGYASNEVTFALARLGVGLGEAAFVAPAYSLLSDYFPPRKRGLAFALMGTGYFIGQFAGLTGGAAIADSHGWRAAFVAMGIPGILLAAMFYRTVREPARERAAGTAVSPSFRNAVKCLWGLRSYRLLTIGSSLGSFATYAFAMWGPAFFLRVHELPMRSANTAFAIGYGLSCLIGTLASGVLSNRFAQRRVEAPMQLAAAAMLSLVVCLILTCLAGNFRLAFAFMVLGGVLGGGYSVAVLAALHDLVPAEIKATATAIWSFIYNFVGFVWGPLSVGVLSDWLAGASHSGLRYALLMTSCVGVLGAVLLFSSSRHLAADVRRVEALRAAG